MIISLNANPGQTIFLIVSTENSDGYRESVTPNPIVSSVFLPDGYEAANFPASMVAIDAGLYRLPILIGQGAMALGTYVATIEWQMAGKQNIVTYVINVSLPFGNSSIIPA